MSWQPPEKPGPRFVAPRSGWGESRGRGLWLTLLGVVLLLALAAWLRP